MKFIRDNQCSRLSAECTLEQRASEKLLVGDDDTLKIGWFTLFAGIVSVSQLEDWTATFRRMMNPLPDEVNGGNYNHHTVNQLAVNQFPRY